MCTRSEKSQPGKRMCSICSKRNRDIVLLKEREMEKEGGTEGEKNRNRNRQSNREQTIHLGSWWLANCWFQAQFGAQSSIRYLHILIINSLYLTIATSIHYETCRGNSLPQSPSSHDWERSNLCDKFFIAHHLFSICSSDTAPTHTWGSTITPPVSCLTSPSFVICKEGKTISSL